MRINSGRETYRMGMLLEAGMLNRDFALAHFLVEECAASSLSDGLISGMAVLAREGALFLQKGVFRYKGTMGWLLEEMELELPPLQKTCFLCLEKSGETSWNLEWREQPDGALALCRIKLIEPKSLRNSFHLPNGVIPALENWRIYLNGPDYVQLEYAMCASRGSKPTLSPGIQRALAPFAKPELRLWLLNGLFPFMDYFGVASWQEGLDKLFESFTDGQIKTVASAPKSRSIV